MALSAVQKAMIEALEDRLLHGDLTIDEEKKVMACINKIKAAATK